MHPKQIRKVLEDDDTFDVAKAAEAVLEDARIREKKSKPRKRANSIIAYQKLKAREQEQEAFRQRLADAWNKTRK